MLKNFSLDGITILSMITAVATIILGATTFIKAWSRGERKYDVFMIENNELTVLSGIPARYRLNDIEMIIFSKAERMGSYTGRMKIMKKGGIFGRTFLFDSSVYRKKVVFHSTCEEIEFIIEDFIKQLGNHGIKCKKK